jgi:hypothetical protein
VIWRMGDYRSADRLSVLPPTEQEPPPYQCMTVSHKIEYTIVNETTVDTNPLQLCLPVGNGKRDCQGDAFHA